MLLNLWYHFYDCLNNNQLYDIIFITYNCYWSSNKSKIKKKMNSDVHVNSKMNCSLNWGYYFFTVHWIEDIIFFFLKISHLVKYCDQNKILLTFTFYISFNWLEPHNKIFVTYKLIKADDTTTTTTTTTPEIDKHKSPIVV